MVDRRRPYLLLADEDLIPLAEGGDAEAFAELYNFKLKVNVATTNISYEAWREGEHDDLVLAAALAVWAADRRRNRVAVFR